MATQKNPRAKMSTSICLGRPAGGHGFRGRMEDHMNDLFSAHWRDTGRKAAEQEADWLHRSPSGFGRLLAAVAIIGIAVSLFDYASVKSPAGTSVANGSSQEGR
jgi:hypothetical protein